MTEKNVTEELKANNQLEWVAKLEKCLELYLFKAFIYKKYKIMLNKNKEYDIILKKKVTQVHIKGLKLQKVCILK